MVLSFANPDTALASNLCMCQTIGEALTIAGESRWLQLAVIVVGYSGRGSDVLVYRALKAFGIEQMPLKRFAPNGAISDTMLISFFLYKAFKNNGCAPAVKTACYATTLRRRTIDIAAKIVRHAGQAVLNIMASASNHLNFALLWQKIASPPRYFWL